VSLEESMTLNVCPADEVRAPIDIVSTLLTTTAAYGSLWDLTVDHIAPPGRAVAGQRIDGWARAFCRRWRVSGQIVDVDTANHTIQFRMTLPLGVVSDNRISCTPLDATRCLVRFG
jgi:hypothetical protein